LCANGEILFSFLERAKKVLKYNLDVVLVAWHAEKDKDPVANMQPTHGVYWQFNLQARLIPGVVA